MDKDEVIKRLDQQITMMKHDFTQWVENVMTDKEFAFNMSDHFAAFSEILKSDQE